MQFLHVDELGGFNLRSIEMIKFLMSDFICIADGNSERKRGSREEYSLLAINLTLFLPRISINMISSVQCKHFCGMFIYIGLKVLTNFLLQTGDFTDSLNRQPVRCRIRPFYMYSSWKNLPYYSQIFDVQAIRTRRLSYIISYMDLKDSDFYWVLATETHRELV